MKNDLQKHVSEIGPTIEYHSQHAIRLIDKPDLTDDTLKQVQSRRPLPVLSLFHW